MTNSDIYFSIFSETIHIILKIFSQHDLRKVRGKGYCKKKLGLRIFGQNFWLGCFSAFKPIIQLGYFGIDLVATFTDTNFYRYLVHGFEAILISAAILIQYH